MNLFKSMEPFMDILKLMIGMFSAMSLGAMGLFLYMLKVPHESGFAPPYPVYINIHFLGGCLMFFAFIMFVLGYWNPVTPGRHNIK